MDKQHKLFDGNTGRHYALVREKNKAEIELKTKGLPLRLLTFADFGEPLLELVRMIAKPVSPKDTPPVPPEKTDAEPEDLPVPMAKESGVSSKRMALLSASPVNDEQNWKPYLDELKKIACPIDHFSLSRDNLNNLQGYDYVLILSKVIKNRLLIENEYLCSDKISFQDLEGNIGTDETIGLFILVDQLPAAKFTAELSRPTFILSYNDKHFKDVKFHLFKKNNLDYFTTACILNRSDFRLCPLTGENGIHAKKTPLPESSINPKDLKGFIGRSDDLEHICRKLMGLEQGEVLTIKGAGGIGKTHIVKKIAVAMAERGLFSGGIHFIALTASRSRTASSFSTKPLLCLAWNMRKMLGSIFATTTTGRNA